MFGFVVIYTFDYAVFLQPKRCHKNSLPLRVFAFGEFALVRCVITNKFALHSLTRNFALFKKRESFTTLDLLQIALSKVQTFTLLMSFYHQ